MPNIVTDCKDCVFATLANNIMSTQVGCALNRIYWYKKQGETVELNECVYEDDDTYHTKLYYRIPNRLCMAHRVQTWQQDKTIEEKIDIVYQEMAIECHVIVLVKPNEHLSVVLNTIKAICIQKCQPTYLTIIIRIKQNINENIDRIKVIEFLKKHIGTKFRWRIQNILENVDDDNAVNMVLDIENSHQYFMIIHSSVILPDDILSQLNDHITKKLLMFWYIQGNKNGDGIVCSNQIAKMYGVNHNQSLFDKIDNDFKDNRELWNKRIFQINKLIPNFPE